MKILLLVNSLAAGGAEVLTVNLAIQLKKMGHDLTLYTYAGILDAKGQKLKQELRNADVTYYTGTKNPLKAIFSIRKIIRKFKPDIIHSNLEQSDTLLMLSQPFKFFVTTFKKNRSCWLRTIHNEYATPKIPKIAHLMLQNFFDASIGCSKSVADAYPFLGTRYPSIENGIFKPVPTIVPTAHLQLIRTTRPQAAVFTHIGSFTPRNNVLQKSQDTILQAISLLQELDFTVIFIGGGEALEEMKSVSQRTNIAEKCLFLGVYDSPTTLLYQSDAFLLPSRFEGMPISCLEAIGCSKPMILSDIPSLARFKTDATLYCKPDNPVSLAQKMREFIENKKSIIELAEKIFPGEFVKYSIEECANKYLVQYMSLLNPSI